MSNLLQIQNDLQAKRKELQYELTRIDAALSALSGLGRSGSATAAINPTGRRVLSLGARRRIAAAQRARWAKVRAQKKGMSNSISPKPARVMSIGARRRIAAAQRARWAKVRAQKKAA
jgi:hypothetical protein